jgi:hypothetical protein
VVKVCFLEHD